MKRPLCQQENSRAATSGRPCPRARHGTQRLLAGWLGLLSAILAGACTYKVVPQVDLPQPPAVEPLPVTVGVHYGPALREWRHLTEPLIADNFAISLGPPSIAAFDQVLPAMFRRVVPVEGRPPWLAPAPAVDAVVEIEADLFSFPLQATFGHGSEMAIVYRVTLLSVSGEPIASWFVTGFDRNVRWTALFRGQVEQQATRVIRAAVAQFAFEFGDRPEVRAWLERVQAGGSHGGATR